MTNLSIKKSLNPDSLDVTLSIVINLIIISSLFIYGSLLKGKLNIEENKNTNPEISIVSSNQVVSKNDIINSSELSMGKGKKIEVDNVKTATTMATTRNEVRNEVKSEAKSAGIAGKVEIDANTKNISNGSMNMPSGLVDKGSYYLAENANVSGINYQILSQVNPDTTILRQRNYSEKLVIKAKILVSESGKVESVSIISGANPYGIHAEVIKALKQWKFSKLSYNGKPLKIYFTKTFIL